MKIYAFLWNVSVFYDLSSGNASSSSDEFFFLLIIHKLIKWPWLNLKKLTCFFSALVSLLDSRLTGFSTTDLADTGLSDAAIIMESTYWFYSLNSRNISSTVINKYIVHMNFSTLIKVLKIWKGNQNMWIGEGRTLQWPKEG